MKKLLLIPIMLLMFSCSKDDNCECKYYDFFDASADCNFSNKWDDTIIETTAMEEEMVTDFNKYRCEK